MSEQANLKLVISGRVQGVFFRDFTLQKAQGLGLVGYVRNLPDGAVEVFAEGERPALEKFLIQLKRGPPHASVDHVSISWGESSGTSNAFKIRY